MVHTALGGRLLHKSEYKNLILNDKLAFAVDKSILKALEGELLIRKDFHSQSIRQETMYILFGLDIVIVKKLQ